MKILIVLASLATLTMISKLNDRHIEMNIQTILPYMEAPVNPSSPSSSLWNKPCSPQPDDGLLEESPDHLSPKLSIQNGYFFL